MQTCDIAPRAMVTMKIFLFILSSLPDNCEMSNHIILDVLQLNWKLENGI